MKPLDVYTPPGIGDSMWCLQKILGNTTRDINLFTFERDNVSSPFLAGLTQVKQVQQFKQPYRDYNQFRADCTSNYETYLKFTNDDLDNYDQPIYLEANDFLEHNNHLTTYLPNLETHYLLDWEFEHQNNEEALSLTENKNTVLVYTSSLKHNRLGPSVMGQWRFDYWERLLRELFDKYNDIKIVWVGSSNDKDAGEALSAKFPDNDFHVYVDKPSTFLMPLIRNSKCMITYQSGISCIGLVESAPVYMLYFNHLSDLRYSICPKSTIGNESLYKAEFFRDRMFDTNDCVKWVGNHLEYDQESN